MNINRIILISLTFILGACGNDSSKTSDSVLDSGQFPQKWELVSMSGMVANVPPVSGVEMDWQEYYILASDGTFVKSRDNGEETIMVAGLYKISELEDGKYLKLVYGSSSEIIGNCSNKNEEYLRFETINSLVGTWWACDGPGLFYKRIQ